VVAGKKGDGSCLPRNSWPKTEAAELTFAVSSIARIEVDVTAINDRKSRAPDISRFQDISTKEQFRTARFPLLAAEQTVAVVPPPQEQSFHATSGFRV
jgi:hypothetical protein